MKRIAFTLFLLAFCFIDTLYAVVHGHQPLTVTAFNYVVDICLELRGRYEAT